MTTVQRGIVDRARQQAEAQAVALRALQERLSMEPPSVRSPSLNSAQRSYIERAYDAVLREVPATLPVPLRMESASVLLQSAWPSIESRLKELADER